MKKILIISILSLSFITPLTLNASVYGVVEHKYISSGHPDKVSGYGYGKDEGVVTASCWGNHCGNSGSTTRSNTNVYTSYSEYYGHNVGGAHQSSWSE